MNFVIKPLKFNPTVTNIILVNWFILYAHIKKMEMRTSIKFCET